MSLTVLRRRITRLVWTFRPTRRDDDLEEKGSVCTPSWPPKAARGRGDTVVHTTTPCAISVACPGSTISLATCDTGCAYLNRQRMFAAVAMLALAIGIGSTTAVFSVVNGVLLRPLSYPAPGQLARVAAPGARGAGITDVSGDFRLSPSMFFTYADHNRVVPARRDLVTAAVTVTGARGAGTGASFHLSHGTLQALGAAPLVGRWLSQADQQPVGQARVMLTYGYWQRRFGGDPSRARARHHRRGRDHGGRGR